MIQLLADQPEGLGLGQHLRGTLPGPGGQKVSGLRLSREQ